MAYLLVDNNVDFLERHPFKYSWQMSKYFNESLFFINDENYTAFFVIQLYFIAIYVLN
jgi:hypothetical protein